VTAGSARARSTSVADLEGLLAGVTHRLATVPAGERHLAAAGLAEEGRGALRAGRRAEALATLLRAHEILDAEEPEEELREFPRGLIAYLPRGDRGVPVGPEEDAVSNRLRLALRLAAVRRRDGVDTTPIEARLREAESHHRSGARASAVRCINEALGMLERAEPGGRSGDAPRDARAKGES
jgi:hypothetical protein